MLYTPLLEEEPICIIPKALGFSNRRSIQLHDLEGTDLLIVQKGHDVFHDMIYQEIFDKGLQINIVPVREGIVDGETKLNLRPLVYIASKLSISYQDSIDYIPLAFPQKIPFGLLFREEDRGLFKPFAPIIKTLLIEASNNW